MRRGKSCERVIVKNFSGEVSRSDILLKLVKLYIEDNKGYINCQTSPDSGIFDESDMLFSE